MSEITEIEIDSELESMISKKITIKINDVVTKLSAELSIYDYLVQAEVTGRFLIVINDEIVPKSAYQTTVLNEGDRLDIMSPISGG